MSKPQSFIQEFKTLDYVLANASRILLFAHTMPDPDAAGSVVGLKRFIKSHYEKDVTIGCYSDFPEFLRPVLGDQAFIHPDHLDLESFDVAIGCDSVDRGFDQIVDGLSDECVTVSADHHHDITLETDVRMVEPEYASTTELLYNFARSVKGQITKDTATAWLTGIIGDTGIFQHSNTSAHTLSASADLIRSGASVSGIVNMTFANQKIETLNLWGHALERARFYPDTGLIITAITDADMGGRTPTSEEIKEVATILVNVPDVKASLFLFQVSENRIKASLRTKKGADIDVSEIAHEFGGGGHPMASGFEVPGKLAITPTGTWSVE